MSLPLLLALGIPALAASSSCIGVRVQDLGERCERDVETLTSVIGGRREQDAGRSRPR